MLQIEHYSCFIDGGAGTAARRLHDSLRKVGTESQFYYSERRNRDKDKSLLDSSYQVADWDPQASLMERVDYQYNRQLFQWRTSGRPNGTDLFTSPRGDALTSRPHRRSDTGAAAVGRGNPDSTIIHLHWIAKFIDLQSFFRSVPQQMPIVWTLHDMNPLTGGCHFSGGCENFASGCGNCPQLRGPSPSDASARAHAVKTKAYSKRNLHVVTPSRWLLDQAKLSSVFGSETAFRHIPYSIDADRYRPIETAAAKRKLGVRNDAFVFVFGAADVDSMRKGANYLVESLAMIADVPNVHGVVFGRGGLPRTNQSMPKILPIGMVTDLQTRRMVYSAADAFILPSLEDNLPLTGLEAMACGTPIIGFDAGGIPDYVQPGITGLLAKTGDSRHLASKLRWATEHPEQLRRMGLAARQQILDRYAAPIEAEAYRELYRDLSANESGEQDRKSQTVVRRAA